jgi:hypothetical protein
LAVTRSGMIPGQRSRVKPIERKVKRLNVWQNSEPHSSSTAPLTAGGIGRISACSVTLP